MENKHRSALIIVDCQTDFVTGSLAVPGAEHIFPEVNNLIDTYWHWTDPIFYTLDWHPDTTPHFDEWPAHCVAGTEGAEWYSDLDVIPGEFTIYKGMGNEPGYSAFDGLGHKNLLSSPPDKTLDELLKEFGVEKVFLCGIAFDYCVMNTALDAVKHGYDTYVYVDACASVSEDSAKIAEEKMRKAGIHFLLTREDTTLTDS